MKINARAGVLSSRTVEIQLLRNGVIESTHS